MKDESKMSELESLKVISTMIEKAKTSYHDNGTGSILWGVVITFCSLVTWSRIHFDYSLPYDFDIWLLTLIAIIPTIIISIREGKKKKVTTYDDVAMNAVWTIFGFSVFLIIHTTNAAGAAFNQLKDTVEQAGMARPSVYFSDYSSAYLLTMYGIPTLVTAAIKSFRPMLIGGIICWVCAVVTVYTSREVDMLLMAASATAAWLIPGIILNRMYKAKRTAANV